MIWPPTAIERVAGVTPAAPQPPSGQYRVEVHYWGDCGAAGVTPATLSIAVGGQIIGAYNVTLQPRERQPVAMFTIP